MIDASQEPTFQKQFQEARGDDDVIIGEWGPTNREGFHEMRVSGPEVLAP